MKNILQMLWFILKRIGTGMLAVMVIILIVIGIVYTCNNPLYPAIIISVLGVLFALYKFGEDILDN